MADTSSADHLDRIASIVSAYVGNNSVRVDELSGLISTIALALENVGAPQIEEQKALVPAIAIKKSVTPDFIICLEDGQPFKSLKRHIVSKYGLTPEDYRAKWGLPHDYPMVAPNYAAARSLLAKQIGLGRKAAPEPAPTPSKKPAARKRAA